MKALAALAAAVLVAGSAFVQAGEKPAPAHKAIGIVKKVDVKAGTVTLAHEPVQSLKWPAMTMAFKVQDTVALEKLGEGRKVEVDFEQRGKDYVITGLK